MRTQIQGAVWDTGSVLYKGVNFFLSNCKGFTGCLPHFIFGFSLNYPHVPSNSINLLT